MHSLLASNDARPVTLRLRPDLVIHEQWYGGQRAWLVKDPVRLKYFRFAAEEMCLLQGLNGERSLRDLRDEFERRFAPRKITLSEVQRLLGMAHRGGLLLAESPGQGSVLWQRQRESTRWQWRQVLNQLLAIRLRGFDPDALLEVLTKVVGWLFSRTAVVAGLVGVVAALGSIGIHWELFWQRLPAADTFFASSNWLPLAMTLAALKICHELGHGISCKQNGGECHEMGLMFLCFSPCLYCDVSDAWTLRDKWRRIAISCAGVYVELWLATLATCVWWHTSPGIVNSLALNVMFVGTVSTLLFNANPLMRYDGYYVLADFCEITNLRSKAEHALRSVVLAWLGFETTGPRAGKKPRSINGWLIAYAVASTTYQWMLAASIWWFLYWLTEPWGFKIVGQLLALAALVSLLLVPLLNLGQYFLSDAPRQPNTLNSSQWLLRLGLPAFVVGLALAYPLPRSIICSAQLAPTERALVYVDEAGVVADILVAPGDEVAAGQPLLRLRNLDLEQALLTKQGECDHRAQTLKSWEQQALSDPSARSQLAELKESVRGLEKELAALANRCEKLTIRAPRSGVVFATQVRPPPDPEQTKGMLSRWHGHPLEPRNRGALLLPSDAVCEIADPTEWQAKLVIDGRELPDVEVGRVVRVAPQQAGGASFAGELLSLSKRELERTDAALSHQAGGTVLSRIDPQGAHRPYYVTYEGLASLHDPPSHLTHGGIALAKIECPPLSLLGRGWKQAKRWFYFEL